MRFDRVKMGEKFFFAASNKASGIFSKKSASSAFTLDPVTMEPAKLLGFWAVQVGFGAAVEVYPLNMGSREPAATLLPSRLLALVDSEQ